MELCDLQAGYVVKLRDKDLYFVANYNNEDPHLILVNRGNWCDLHKNFSNKLDYLLYSDYDIMEVYGLSDSPFDSFSLSTEGRPLLWKRSRKKRGLRNSIPIIYDYTVDTEEINKIINEE